MKLPSLDSPTLLFIGVTTSQSSIMKVFPEWARHLGLQGASIAGLDLKLHDRPGRYREAVSFLKSEPNAAGALVTTHKLDLFAACRDMFDEIDSHARLMSEVSCLSKRKGGLACFAKDPAAAGLALGGFVPEGHFACTGSDAFCMGAGGSAIAITWNLMRKERGADRPARIIVSNRSEARLEHIRNVHRRTGSDVPVEYVHAPRAGDNDRALAGLKPGSLVVNATGLGKDAPGSPLTSAALFPEAALAWDLNYRGDIVFLAQSRSQGRSRGVVSEDGWQYFVHGWAQAIIEVFGVELPVSGPRFEEFAAIAARAAGRA